MNQSREGDQVTYIWNAMVSSPSSSTATASEATGSRNAISITQNFHNQPDRCALPFQPNHADTHSGPSNTFLSSSSADCNSNNVPALSSHINQFSTTKAISNKALATINKDQYNALAHRSSSSATATSHFNSVFNQSSSPAMSFSQTSTSRPTSNSAQSLPNAANCNPFLTCLDNADRISTAGNSTAPQGTTISQFFMSAARSSQSSDVVTGSSHSTMVKDSVNCSTPSEPPNSLPASSIPVCDSMPSLTMEWVGSPPTSTPPGNCSFPTTLANSTTVRATSTTFSSVTITAQSTTTATNSITSASQSMPGPSSGTSQTRIPVQTGQLGIITGRPKNFSMAVPVKRLESFRDWPPDRNPTKDQLANAGFYYTGQGDSVRCFCCGGGLKNWDPLDDAYVEHARSLPLCPYIRHKLGEEFISKVRELAGYHKQITFQMVMASMQGDALTRFLARSEKKPLLQDEACKALCQEEYNQADVLECARMLKQNGHCLSSIALFDMLDERGFVARQEQEGDHEMTDLSVDDSQDLSRREEELKVLQERNKDLCAQVMCKLCFEEEVSMVFLPCGHLACCSECAWAMKECPVCRENIRAMLPASMG